MKWAINGFGRIGRGILRTALQRGVLNNIAAIHDFVPVEASAHLVKYDSLFGPLECSVSVDDGHLVVDGHAIPYLHKITDHSYPWNKLDIDCVLECTGKMTNRSDCQNHIAAGAKRVLLSAPSKDPEMKTLVYGVNHTSFDHKTDTVVSNASCTTNCLAPLAKVLHDRFGIIRGLMTTVHSYTNDQRILDTAHSDLRRARAAALNMIPTTTGAAKAVGRVIPELNGKIDGFALRVPTPNVSFVDFVAELKTATNADAVNQALTDSAEGNLKGVLDVTHAPAVSTDFLGSPYSSTVDAGLTMCLNDTMVKVCSWYDNEYGFCHRMLDMMTHICKA